MNFARERLEAELKRELEPLLLEHWKEIAFYKDIPLEPDWARYRQMEEMGMLRLFTVREEGKLVGYAVFLVLNSLHYRSHLQATCDVVYLSPESRGGTGRVFLSWCDLQLAGEGVDLITHHVKVAQDWSPVLERMGYDWMDKILVRRIKRHEMKMDTIKIEGLVGHSGGDY